MTQIKIHHPHPATHLPAHEQTARKHRTHTGHLPAIPGHKPHQPKPPTARPDPSRWPLLFGGSTCNS